MKEKKQKPEKIRCEACPVMCFIAEGQSGACDRYANENGQLIRLEALTILEKYVRNEAKVVSFLPDETEVSSWDRALFKTEDKFITAIGAGTTYPDYKPAPFIVSTEIDGIDMVTVVTEGIFSYCGAKIKIDTDRHLGPERNFVRVNGEPVGHVTTSEYGSQMLSLGGVNHLTGGEKKEGRVTCAALLELCNGGPVELKIDDGCELVVQANKAPIINNVEEKRMRVGCGSAAIGMFASQWKGLVDEVVVVDDHITGVMSEHQAGKAIGWPASGIKIKGRRSTPGRYFQVANPGTGWGGTDLVDPLSILGTFNPKVARPEQTLLMVSTTGEHFSYYKLDESLHPFELEMPETLRPSINRIDENCEPALCSVLFMGGAGGSLRAGVTENPILLTRATQNLLTKVTCGGSPTYRWPGGGITVMVDVSRMPENSFGYVPTPALVAPIEFTLKLSDYKSLGGHLDHIISIEDAIANNLGMQGDNIISGQKVIKNHSENPWPLPAARKRKL